jgi:hypothetical protein
MSYEVTGKLILKSETIQRTDKFKVRDFVLEQTEVTNDKTFTNFIKLQASNAKADLLDTVTIGSEVTVNFNLRGNKYEKEGKTSFFTNLDAWKIEVVKKAEKNAAISNAVLVEEEPADDLPF